MRKDRILCPVALVAAGLKVAPKSLDFLYLHSDNTLRMTFVRLAWPVPLACVVSTTLCACKKESANTASARPPVQVVAIEARRQPVSETLPQVGTLMADESVEIKSETDGTVEEISFQEGQLVEKGQLLVKLDESKLAASLGEAEASYKLSQANFERAKQLASEKLISQQEFDQMAATFDVSRATLELKRRQLKDARIYAPFAGAIGARNVSPGQVITKDAVLTWLVDFDPIKAEVNVPERFLSQLQIGQIMQFKVAAHQDREFRGEVYFISPNVDQNSRTALVKARIPNPQLLLKPGMFANVDLTLRVRGSSVVIPEAALSQVLEGDRATIYLVDAHQTAQARNVALGVRLAGWVEIVGGLDGGETVVVEGVQKITPGSKVRFAPAEAAAPYRPEVVHPDEPAKAAGNGGGKQS
jgi:membrane fusion protein (multidrug efflux system)